jgi:hypothetical protein
MDVFWLIFLFSMLAPLVRQRALEAARLRRIAKPERQRSSRVIVLVHCQETMRLLGVPLLRYLDVNDSEEILRAIQLTDDDLPLDVVLHTPGGLVLAAAQIATALRAYKSKVTVFVPPLRDVWRHLDHAGGQRDRDEPARRARTRRSAAQRHARRVIDHGCDNETHCRRRR